MQASFLLFLAALLSGMAQSRVVTASFSSRLHQLLDEKGLTQRQLADFAGVNEATVSRWLSGSVPTLESVQSVARKIGAPLAWLAFGEGALDPRPLTIETFSSHVREKILPRLDSIIERLDSILLEPWLSHVDSESFDAMRGQFGQRRARLVQLIRSMEQLPTDDIPAIEKRLFGEEILDGSLVDLRFKLCRMLFLDGSASDDEVLLAMKAFLEEPGVSSKVKGTAVKILKSVRIGQDIADIISYQEGGQTKYKAVPRSKKSSAKAPAK